MVSISRGIKEAKKMGSDLQLCTSAARRREIMNFRVGWGEEKSEPSLKNSKFPGREHITPEKGRRTMHKSPQNGRKKIILHRNGGNLTAPSNLAKMRFPTFPPHLLPSPHSRSTSSSTPSPIFQDIDLSHPRPKRRATKKCRILAAPSPCMPQILFSPLFCG